MKKFFMLAFSSLLFSAAHADGFTAVPTAWVAESYGANLVVLWYTPASCGNGQVILPAGAAQTEHNRLYATILAAKASGLKVFVNYSATSGVCVISSFGLAN